MNIDSTTVRVHKAIIKYYILFGKQFVKFPQLSFLKSDNYFAVYKGLEKSVQINARRNEATE